MLAAASCLDGLFLDDEILGDREEFSAVLDITQLFLVGLCVSTVIGQSIW